MSARLPHSSSSTPFNPVTSVRRHQRLLPGSLSLVLLAALSACGGGGGGGSPSANTNADATAASDSTTSGNFPVGMALASPVALGNPGDVVSGGLGIVSPSVSVTKVPLQGVWASRADAIATNRQDLASSGWLSVSALFNTSTPTDSSCYGPSVAYVNHDDSGTSGTLPAGRVAMWSGTDSGSPALACSAAQVESRTGVEAAQIQQAVLLMASLRQILTRNPALTPTVGSTTNLVTQASALLGPLLSGVTVNTATASVAADATTGNPNYSYRLVLTRGSGSSVQSIEIAMVHTPTETDLRYLGSLQITMGYLSADASLGCTDQIDSGTGLYKTSRLTSLFYNREYDRLSVRARAGQYCGNPSVASSTHMADLATLTTWGELDQEYALPSPYNVKGTRKAWRSQFSSWTTSMYLSTLDQDFRVVWQASPDDSGNTYARLMAGTMALDTSTGTRSTMFFHGYTGDITSTLGSLDGFICNDGGPSSTSTVHSLFQYQRVTMASSASNWTLGTSNISYAPTNSCNASASMSYNDGTGMVSNTSHALLGISAAGATTVEEEIGARGYNAPEFFP